jgi:hypothetical protein
LSDCPSKTVQTEEVLRKEIQACDAKLDRLMVGYLDQRFSPEEYKEKKAALVKEKHDLAEKLAGIAKNRKARFEPITRFVLRLKQAKIVA